MLQCSYNSSLKTWTIYLRGFSVCRLQYITLSKIIEPVLHFVLGPPAHVSCILHTVSQRPKQGSHASNACANSSVASSASRLPAIKSLQCLPLGSIRPNTSRPVINSLQRGTLFVTVLSRGALGIKPLLGAMLTSCQGSRRPVMNITLLTFVSHPAYRDGARDFGSEGGLNQGY